MFYKQDLDCFSQYGLSILTVVVCWEFSGCSVYKTSVFIIRPSPCWKAKEAGAYVHVDIRACGRWCLACAWWSCQLDWTYEQLRNVSLGCLWGYFLGGLHEGRPSLECESPSSWSAENRRSFGKAVSLSAFISCCQYIYTAAAAATTTIIHWSFF